MSQHQAAGVPQTRIIRGANNWWFLGPGGIARLRAPHLTPGGDLTPAAEAHLRRAGLYRTAPRRRFLLTVLTSTDCNLGCGYCFQNTGQDLTGGSRPPRITHARLTSGMITTVLEFARRQMARSGLEQLHILLFGGEPLLNPRGCLELLDRAAGYGLASASMISNLTLLTPALAARLAAGGLRSVQLTLDGDRENHDAIRVRRSGGGTFDAIIARLNAASAAAPGLRWSLRVNVSHHNQAGIADLVNRLGETLDASRCGIYFARVGDTGIGYGNDLRHTADLARRFSAWQRQALELGFSVARPHAHLPCQTCSYPSGRYGAVVSADGTLSSCWETAGKPGWDVGTASEGYLAEELTRPRWVACEDRYQYSDDDTALSEFRDRVDAALLDYLSATGRL